jgi:hypothetical protein
MIAAVRRLSASRSCARSGGVVTSPIDWPPARYGPWAPDLIVHTLANIIRFGLLMFAAACALRRIGRGRAAGRSGWRQNGLRSN